MKVSFLGVLSLFVAVAFSSVPTLAFVRGDANSDAVVDISDAIVILGVLFVPGTTPLDCQDMGDANDDGVLDISDGIYVLNFLFVPGSPAMPAPYPDDGDDPTTDSLTPDCPPVGGGPPGPFSTYSSGQDSGAPEGEYLMFSQADLDGFWALHGVGIPPVVNFANDIVVALVRDYPSPDHCCEIADLSDSGSTVDITYVHWQVGLPCFLSFLSPTPAYHVVIWENAAGVSSGTTAFEMVLAACPLVCP